MELVNFILPNILFYLFCILSLVCALGVVVIKNPVSAAFSLIGVLLSVAGIFAFQEAYFISAVQILVYAGAIMVLFVFVIMLLSLDQVDLDWPTQKFYWPIPVAIGAALFGVLAVVLGRGHATVGKGPFTPEAIERSGGNVRVVSEVMFSDYLVPFLVVGMLLSAAIVGCVVLAKRKVE